MVSQLSQYAKLLLFFVSEFYCIDWELYIFQVVELSTTVLLNEVILQSRARPRDILLLMLTFYVDAMFQSLLTKDDL